MLDDPPDDLPDLPDPILTAAAALLDAGDDFTMAALAARAGVSRGTLYRRYRDRAAVLDALAAARGVSVAALGAEPRARALDALGALIAERGLAGLSVEAVAKRAGLGAATVYRHFTDRRGLIQAFAAERSPRRLIPRIDAGDDVHATLVEVAGALLRFMRDHPAVVRLLFAPDPESRALIAEMRDGPRRTADALTALFTREVEAGRLMGSPAMIAASFVGLVIGLGWFDSRPGLADVDGSARWVADVLLAGCRPKEA